MGFDTGTAVGVVSGGSAVSSDPRFTARKSSAWCRAARGGDTGGATSADQRLGAPHSLLGLGGAAQLSSAGIRCELFTGLAGADHLLVIVGVSTQCKPIPAASSLLRGTSTQACTAMQLELLLPVGVHLLASADKADLALCPFSACNRITKIQYIQVPILGSGV